MKKLKDAFYKYNVTENKDYLTVNSDNYDYDDIQNGDIIFVSKYKYTKNKPGHYHLFLVINKYGIYVHGMLITSNIEKEWYLYNIPVCKDDKNNLKYDSLIKTDNIYLIEKKNILNKIGTLTPNLYKKCINLNKLQ